VTQEGRTQSKTGQDFSDYPLFSNKPGQVTEKLDYEQNNNQLQKDLTGKHGTLLVHFFLYRASAAVPSINLSFYLTLNVITDPVLI
jgi:hypothetical protein